MTAKNASGAIVQLESHRSLFNKIEIQLTHNKEHYLKRIKELVINHPYFDKQYQDFNDDKAYNQFKEQA